MQNCPFCNIDKTKIYNTVLDETKYFYVIPDRCSIVDGYILIISKSHINSMADLKSEEMLEYENLIHKYREIFYSIYKKYPIIFEHGTPKIEDKNKANSIFHSHTHIVNHNYKNEKSLLEKENFRKVTKIMDIDNNKNYIFYTNPNNEIYVTNNFKPISQFMRIEIAKDLNLLDYYDWHKNYFQDNVLSTINRVNEKLNERKDNKNFYSGILN